MELNSSIPQTPMVHRLLYSSLITPYLEFLLLMSIPRSNRHLVRMLNLPGLEDNVHIRIYTLSGAVAPWHALRLQFFNFVSKPTQPSSFPSLR